MGTITGSSTAEIEAPIEQVWEVVEDILTAPDWQGGLKDMNEIERDADGHVTLAESGSDAKVRTIGSTVRFTYTGPRHLGAGRTRATFNLEVNLGCMLSLVIRGPLIDVLRGQLVGARANELKQRVEHG